MAKQSFSNSYRDEYRNEPQYHSFAPETRPTWQSLLVRLAPLILLVILAATTYYLATSARALVVGTLTELPTPEQANPSLVKRNVQADDMAGTELMIGSPSVSVFQPKSAKLIVKPAKRVPQRIKPAPQTQPADVDAPVYIEQSEPTNEPTNGSTASDTQPVTFTTQPKIQPQNTAAPSLEAPIASPTAPVLTQAPIRHDATIATPQNSETASPVPVAAPPVAPQPVESQPAPTD